LIFFFLDINTIQWEIDFFPRGIRFNRAQLINVHQTSLQSTNKVEVPESILKTVRVRCTCRGISDEEQRFKIAVLVSGIQNNVNHIKSLHTRTAYFSRENRAINFDNVVPYDELSTDRSVFLIGNNRDTVKIQVIIVPMQQNLVQESPTFEFK
jgi:BTB/POZ domain-containing protein 17